MKNLLLKIIDIYIKYLSPLIVRIFGHSCRFMPTCSVYFKEAVKKHGVGRGVVMGTKRIIKCNPFTKAGFDPVI